MYLPQPRTATAPRDTPLDRRGCVSRGKSAVYTHVETFDIRRETTRALVNSCGN